MRCLAACSALLGTIIGVSALVIIPAASLEGWKCDPLIPLMLVASLGLLFLSCHCLDCLAKARREDFRRSL